MSKSIMEICKLVIKAMTDFNSSNDDSDSKDE